MVDIMDLYKSLNISTGTAMKNKEMLKLVSDDLKTKIISKHAVKEFLYLLRYVLDQHKTQQICDRSILENGGTLKSVPYCYKKQEMYNNTVDNYLHALEFVSGCFMAQECVTKRSVLILPQKNLFLNAL